VDLLDEAADLIAGVFGVPVAAAVDLFLLQGLNYGDSALVGPA
jgi:hypothetical protein